MNSCSTRLDWEYRTRSRLNRLTLGVFVIAGVLLLILATSLRMVIAQESAMRAFYWSIAFATTYGAGPDPATSPQYMFTITWMLLCVTYWAAMFGAIATWIGDFFEK